jgi:hypothetical protein
LAKQRFDIYAWLPVYFERTHQLFDKLTVEPNKAVRVQLVLSASADESSLKIEPFSFIPPKIHLKAD